MADRGSIKDVLIEIGVDPNAVQVYEDEPTTASNVSMIVNDLLEYFVVGHPEADARLTKENFIEFLSDNGIVKEVAETTYDIFEAFDRRFSQYTGVTIFGRWTFGQLAGILIIECAEAWIGAANSQSEGSSKPAGQVRPGAS